MLSLLLFVNVCLSIVKEMSKATKVRKDPKVSELRKNLEKIKRQKIGNVGITKMSIPIVSEDVGKYGLTSLAIHAHIRHWACDLYATIVGGCRQPWTPSTLQK